MALQLLQNYNSHHAWTGWDDGSCTLATAAEPHRLCKTAVSIQDCCTNCDSPAADLPHNSASSTDVLSYSAPITMKNTVLIVLSLLYFVVERYYSAREEGTGGAGTVGEENLTSHDWCVPH